ncbi:hypothetical protein PROFUN_00839 [Planoprotostelium fungivorum]|uniref:J domain-containing protein n=1 Tax=Planoprotostelium fungivorum TaxID=1890364 RepID=A0A2P6P024_9EUKA|nr:hypothetical protein PROFUN_00839 [Planoprotostelium fungivorum]
MGRIICFLLLLLFIAPVQSHTDSYYDVINAILGGKDLYQMLNVTTQSTTKEIKRSFRQLSRIYHPDKLTGEDAESKKGLYQQLVFAADVLTDDEKRKEYDDLRVNGVPRAARIYSQYAYFYGAPNIDLRYILGVLVALISGCQWLYVLHRHHRMHRLAKNTQRYQSALKIAQSNGEDMPELRIVGAEKPQLKDIFVLRLILLPYTVTKGLFSLVFGRSLTAEEADEALRIRMGFDTREEWEEHKRKDEQRWESRKNSNRAKQYRRWMKKHRYKYPFSDEKAGHGDLIEPMPSERGELYQSLYGPAFKTEYSSVPPQLSLRIEYAWMRSSEKKTVIVKGEKHSVLFLDWMAKTKQADRERMMGIQKKTKSSSLSNIVQELPRYLSTLPNPTPSTATPTQRKHTPSMRLPTSINHLSLLVQNYQNQVNPTVTITLRESPPSSPPLANYIPPSSPTTEEVIEKETITTITPEENGQVTKLVGSFRMFGREILNV